MFTEPLAEALYNGSWTIYSTFVEALEKLLISSLYDVEILPFQMKLKVILQRVIVMFLLTVLLMCSFFSEKVTGGVL